MLLHGIFPPITTPFYPDGAVYFRKLEQNVERYCRAPLAGLVALGSTGEAILLSDQERREVLQCVREGAAAEKVLIAGTGMESAAETLRLTEYAARLGYDVALVRTPHYYKSQIHQPANMLAFYRFVADRSPLPVLIYNFPQATSYDIPPTLVIELAGHPNIIGIKDSSGSIEKVRIMAEGTAHVKRCARVTATFEAVTPRMKAAASMAAPAMVVTPEALASSARRSQVSQAGAASFFPSATAAAYGIKTREKEIGFQVLVGAAQKLSDSLQAGAVGAILAFADAAPTAMFEVYAAWKEGDMKMAGAKQSRVAAAASRIVGELSIPGLKYACELNGYYGGPVRLPLLPLTAEVKGEIELLMTDIKS